MSALPILFGMFSIPFPCDPSIPLKVEEQPRQEEIIFAAQEAGLELSQIPVYITAIPSECILEDDSAAGVTYGRYRMIFLMNGWRDDGWLTILVHELRHVKQWDADDMVMSECDAADIGARFAYDYKEWDRWGTETIYSMRHCVGGQLYLEPWGADDEWYKARSNFMATMPEFTFEYMREHSLPIIWWGFLIDAVQYRGNEDVDSD